MTIYFLSTQLWDRRGEKKRKEKLGSTSRRECLPTENVFIAISSRGTLRGSLCWAGIGRGVVQDGQMSSVTGVARTKSCFHEQVVRTLREQPKNTLSFGVSPPSLILFLLNKGQGILSAFPVVMHLEVALGYPVPSCPAHADRNVTGKPREHVPRTGSIMLSSRDEEPHGRKGSLG